MNYCTDCKWIVKDEFSPAVPSTWICGHPEADRGASPVTGEKLTPYSCAAERTQGCGPEGKNWEAPPDDPTSIKEEPK